MFVGDNGKPAAVIETVFGDEVPDERWGALRRLGIPWMAVDLRGYEGGDLRVIEGSERIVCVGCTRRKVAEERFEAQRERSISALARRRGTPMRDETWTPAPWRCEACREEMFVYRWNRPPGDVRPATARPRRS